MIQSTFAPNNTPKFRNKNGDLSAYSFACGYVQWASLDGTELGHWQNGKKMYLDGCVYHVKVFKDGQRISWESFDTLGEARKYYRSIIITH